MLFRCRLLRYCPNRLSEEFYNIGLLLYAPDGKLLDAQFSPDFTRLRCNPAADLTFLKVLREDFENRRLAGEDFSHYIEDLCQNLSQGLQLSDDKSFLGDDPVREMERLSRTYLSTPRRSEIHPVESRPGTRRWVLARMRETFRLYHLTERLQSEVEVGRYVSPRFSFQMDYAYKPNGLTHYLHALSLHHDTVDAGRLCFVFDRLRSRAAAQMTAVVADALPADTLALLESSQIRSWAVSKLDDLALAVRSELGL